MSKKKSKPVRIGSAWRILRHDGVCVGWYMTKAQAQAAIDKQAWFE
jgi:hypothetical protein